MLDLLNNINYMKREYYPHTIIITKKHVEIIDDISKYDLTFTKSYYNRMVKLGTIHIHPEFTEIITR
jgi:hypothetical protein